VSGAFGPAWYCPTCRAQAKLPEEPECGSCVLRRKVGRAIEYITGERLCEPGQEDRLTLEQLDALEAIGELWIRHGLTVRAHMKEMREEAREAQRGARDSYHEGIETGQRLEREFGR
jgi:hypothetical protein